MAVPALAQAPQSAPPPAAPPQAAAPPAAAAQNTPARVRGTVVKLDGNMLTVKDKAGKTVMVTLAPNATVRGVAKKTLSDIKPDDFVGITSRPGTDGKQHAVEVHFFPDNLKGVVPQSQTPWDLGADSLMTNAVVAGKVTGKSGDTLSMKYKDQTAEIVVGPKTPIVAFVPGTMDQLKPGRYVVAMGQKHPDGTITVGNITAETKGVKPPM